MYYLPPVRTPFEVGPDKRSAYLCKSWKRCKKAKSFYFYQIIYFLSINGLALLPGDVVDDVDGVGRVEHVVVVGNLLQDFRGGVAIDDHTKISNN